jgi:hypothetical protein
MWNIAAFRMSFVFESGGFQEHYAYHGGLEAFFYQHWTKKKMHLAYLADYRSDDPYVDRNDPALFNPEYQTYKDEHHKGFTGSFEQWLQIHKPELL